MFYVLALLAVASPQPSDASKDPQDLRGAAPGKQEAPADSRKLLQFAAEGAVGGILVGTAVGLVAAIPFFAVPDVRQFPPAYLLPLVAPAFASIAAVGGAAGALLLLDFQISDLLVPLAGGAAVLGAALVSGTCLAFGFPLLLFSFAGSDVPEPPLSYVALPSLAIGALVYATSPALVLAAVIGSSAALEEGWLAAE